MNIKCPACGAAHSLDSLVDDEPAATALMSVLKITPVGRQVVKYLGLFRPEKRQLSWSKVATLLGELMPMIEAKAIKRNGVVYDAPHHVWESAIEKVIEARDMGKLQTPLKSHGYLLEVVITEGKRLSDENLQRADAKKQAERAANDKRMADLQKSHAEAKTEAQPKPREKVIMPESIKQAWQAALVGPAMTQKERVETHTALQTGSVLPTITPKIRLSPEEVKELAKQALQIELDNMTPEERANYQAMRNKATAERRRFNQQLEKINE